MRDMPDDSSWLAASEQRDAWDKAYRQEHPRWRGPSDLDLGRLKGRILELGCGDGKTAMAMAEKGLCVIALDQSMAALSMLKNKASSVTLHLIRGDAIDLPFEEGSFDGVTAVHIIDHLPASARRRAFEEIDRILRPDGVVISRFFSTDDLRFGKGREVEPSTYLRGNGLITHYFNEEEIIALFAGYHVLSVKCSNTPTKFQNESGRRSLITVEMSKP